MLRLTSAERLLARLQNAVDRQWLAHETWLSSAGTQRHLATVKAIEAGECGAEVYGEMGALLCRLARTALAETGCRLQRRRLEDLPQT
jgi:hypothetical protein